MPRTITRNALYDLVWSKPMVKAATEFGISDVGLRKICMKNGIPTPPLGYWARKSAGYDVSRPALPAKTNEQVEEIAIYAMIFAALK